MALQAAIWHQTFFLILVDLGDISKIRTKIFARTPLRPAGPGKHSPGFRLGYSFPATALQGRQKTVSHVATGVCYPFRPGVIK